MGWGHLRGQNTKLFKPWQIIYQKGTLAHVITKKGFSRSLDPRSGGIKGHSRPQSNDFQTWKSKRPNGSSWPSGYKQWFQRSLRRRDLSTYCLERSDTLWRETGPRLRRKIKLMVPLGNYWFCFDLSPYFQTKIIARGNWWTGLIFSASHFARGKKWTNIPYPLASL